MTVRRRPPKRHGVYYNKNNPYCARWLRNLIAQQLLADGHVDRRSIHDVKPEDCKGYHRCHFFAGVGGWELACQLANVPNELKVWTGSCPCQPFSLASIQRKGMADERHLWPTWYDLIQAHRPTLVFGEQVCNAIKEGWLDKVFTDLECAGYTCWATILEADSVGADHKRKRIYWAAYTECTRLQGHQPNEGLFSRPITSHTVPSDTFAFGRRVLVEERRDDLRSCDGVQLAVERRATHAYGNAIVPQLAAEFIRAVLDMLGF